MEFEKLKRRELQALCKLNKIPANITNVAMVAALSSLDLVVGIEDYLKPSESTESSVESPARTEVMSPRAPRTTSTRQKASREEAHTMKTTRRGVTRQIAGEVEGSKTATTLPETPAAPSTRRKAPVASACKNMDTQLKESKEDAKVEESMNQKKKSVTVSSRPAVPSSRGKRTAVSTTRRVNVKEESTFGRTYSTRRSARLINVEVEEQSPVEKESKKLETITSLSPQSFEEMLDESSDGLNEVTKDSSLSGSGVNALAVGIEIKSELLEVEKEKSSSVDTEMRTEDRHAIDAKADVLESIGSNNMDVDVILMDIQNPRELNKLENLGNPETDMVSKETDVEDIKETGVEDDTATEYESPSEESKLEIAEILESNEESDSVDVADAEIGNEVLHNKAGDAYPSVTMNSSETVVQELVATFEGVDTDGESDAATEDPSETFEQENVDADEKSEVATEDPSEIFQQEFVANLEGVDTDQESDTATEDPSESFDQEIVATFEGIDTHGEPDAATEDPRETFEQENVDADEKSEVATEDPSETCDQEFVTNFEGVDTNGESDTTNEDPNETFEQEIVGTDGESDAATEDPSETFKQENVDVNEESDTENSDGIFKQENLENVVTLEHMESDEETAAVIESMVLLEDNVNLNKLEEAKCTFGDDGPLADYVESKDLKKIASVVWEASESDSGKTGSTSQVENQEELGFPVSSPVEGSEIGLVNEEMSDESVDESVVTKISADLSSFSLSSIPSSAVNAVNAQVPSIKTTSLKKSAARMPSQSRRTMTLISDDKENIDQSGTKLQLIKDDEGTKIKTSNDRAKALHEASLRQLTKMLREKLQITNNVNTNADEISTMANKVPKTRRPALQTLSSNSLPATEMGN